MAGPWGGPPQGLLTEPDGVFQVEPADVRPPGKVKSGGPGPAHHSHSSLGGRVRAGTRWTWTRRMVPGTIGRGPRLPWPGWRCCLGCSPAHAGNGHPAVLVVLTDQGGRWGGPGGRVGVVELGAWRRGRPVAPGGRGG